VKDGEPSFSYNKADDLPFVNLIILANTVCLDIKDAVKYIFDRNSASPSGTHNLLVGQCTGLEGSTGFESSTLGFPQRAKVGQITKGAGLCAVTDRTPLY